MRRCTTFWLILGLSGIQIAPFYTKTVKKLIIIALFLLPSTAFASSAQEQYISALQQVISLLIQQVQMLEAQLAQVQNQPLKVAVQSPITESVGAPTVSIAPIDCTPKLEGSVVQEDGDISTGFDFSFIGTSTIPVLCPVQSLENDLQTPDNFYHSKVSDWQTNGHIKQIPTGFVFTQGWGSGAGKTPTGTFIWSVGGATISVTI
jgi:hypothetical protein